MSETSSDVSSDPEGEDCLPSIPAVRIFALECPCGECKACPRTREWTGNSFEATVSSRSGRCRACLVTLGVDCAGPYYVFSPESQQGQSHGAREWERIPAAQVYHARCPCGECYFDDDTYAWRLAANPGTKLAASSECPHCRVFLSYDHFGCYFTAFTPVASHKHYVLRYDEECKCRDCVADEHGKWWWHGYDSTWDWPECPKCWVFVDSDENGSFWMDFETLPDTDGIDGC